MLRSPLLSQEGGWRLNPLVKLALIKVTYALALPAVAGGAGRAGRIKSREDV